MSTTLQDFLGTGWSFPVRVDPTTGRIALSHGEQDIDEAIAIILGTTPGERVMRPHFGSRLADAVFLPTSATTAAAIEGYIRDALAFWEPRIEVIAVTVIDGPQSARQLAAYDPERAYRFLHGDDSDGIVYVDIRYRLRATNSERNLVYPFYHIPGEAAPARRPGPARYTTPMAQEEV